ncbi:MAG: cyclic nucleotide-binding domain-containing protein [Dehalococcoidia bacterium]
MTEEAVALLRTIPLFRQMGLAELYLLTGIGMEEQVPAGTTLGVENEPVTDLWVILEGRVRITSPATGEGESFLEGPAVWGAAALVEPHTSFGTGVTATECRMLRIPAVDLRELAVRNPRLGVRLYQEFATHIFVRLQRLIEESASRNAGRPTSQAPRPARPAARRRDIPELHSPPADALSLLQRVPVLEHLQPDQLRLLFAIGVERHLAPGTLLGRGGEPLDVLWIILEGEVEIDSPLTRGSSIIAGPESWGTASLVPPHTPNGTAVTVTECRALLLRAEDVRALIEQSPRLGVDLYLALSTNVFRRIRVLTDAAGRPLR